MEQVSLAPLPDFRYVGLEPADRAGARTFGVAAASVGLGVLVTLATSSADPRHAVFAGIAATAGAACALGRGRRDASNGARMGIVPWGVLVDETDAPRILRWAGVRRVDVVAAPPRHSRVVVETERDRFVGESLGVVRLEQLATHLDAYAREQSSPLALDLAGEAEGDALEIDEPCVSALLAAGRGWLESAHAARALDLPPAGYRRSAVHASSPGAVEVLRRVLGDRTAKAADPRAFAAVIAAEVRAREVVPDLVRLVQCPHPLVAAVAKQAARKLGVPRAATGSLDEVAPFLNERDRAQLDAWAKG